MVSLVEALDFFAAIEVMDPVAAEEFAQVLNDRTGVDWTVDISLVAVGESSYKEYFAFYYQKNKVSPDNSGAICQSNMATHDDGHTCFLKDSYPQGKAAFERDPFLGSYLINGTSVAVVGVHTIYGKSTLAGLERRKREINNLKIMLEEVHKYDPQHDIIVLGDFNLEIPDDSDETNENENILIPESFSGGSLGLKVLIHEPTTIGKSNYDHIVWSDLNKSQLVADSEEVLMDFDLDEVDEKAEYKSVVSDHFPVAVSFKVVQEY